MKSEGFFDRDIFKISNQSLPNNIDSVLLVMLGKNIWFADELGIVDSLVDFIDGQQSILNKGIIYYCASYAYRDFDDGFSDSLLRQSYVYFKEINDIEGQVFTLYRILYDASLTRKIDINLQQYIVDKYKEIFSLESQTNSETAKLRVLSSLLNYKILTQESLDMSYLDSVEYYLYTNFERPNYFVSTLLSQISYHYYMIFNDIDRALKAAKKAASFISDSNKNKLVYLYNIGVFYSDLGIFDSALYYFYNAYDKYPRNDVIYFTETNRDIALEIASVYKKLGKLDSAYLFLEEGIKYTMNLTDLKLREKRVQADKRYETAIYRTQLNELEIVLQKQRDRQMFLVLVIAVVVLFLVGLLFLVWQSKKLAHKAKRLSENRERLINIVSHDLSGSMNALVTYARIYDEAKQTLSADEFREFKSSFVNSTNAIQTTMQNIMEWGRGLRKGLPPTLQQIDMKQLIAEMLKTYKEFASARDINFEVFCGVSVIKTFPSEISTLFRNLLQNAIKHGVDSSTVSISCENDEKYIYLQIINKCMQEDKMRIVKLLPQIQRNEYQSTDGSLGLELVANSLSRLKGNISFKNSNPDTLYIEICLPLNL
ncbi:MAG: HAMP domain-containing histidine kinase [Oceanicaulis sp.]|nr:HAMP domain-containing histidine kinase [Oceanicaulis sp.]